MRRLVVILGAGASYSAGLPTLAGIFDDMAVRAYLEGEGARFSKFLREYVWQLRGIEADKRVDSLNLEEVLTMLRLWENDEQAPFVLPKMN